MTKIDMTKHETVEEECPSIVTIVKELPHDKRGNAVRECGEFKLLGHFL